MSRILHLCLSALVVGAIPTGYSAAIYNNPSPISFSASSAITRTSLFFFTTLVLSTTTTTTFFSSSSSSSSSSSFLLVSAEQQILIEQNNLIPLEPGFNHDIDDNTITTGKAHACALERVTHTVIGGEVVCWGDNSYNQLESPMGLFVQISAAGHYTCGITVDETIECWGGGGKPSGPNGGRINGAQPYAQVSAGSEHACAVGHDGHIACWGAVENNMHEELDAPIGVFVQVSCGNGQSCGLGRDGTLRCWGNPYGGFLRTVPPGQYLQVSVSPDSHACAIGLDASLHCWGSYFGPQGGHKVWSGTFLQVATGDQFTCAIRGDGTLFCLGEERRVWNFPTGNQRTSPHVPDRNMQFSEISAHNLDICGVTAGETREVYCWGETPALYENIPLDLDPAGGLVLLDF